MLFFSIGNQSFFSSYFQVEVEVEEAVVTVMTETPTFGLLCRYMRLIRVKNCFATTSLTKDVMK